MKRRPEHTVIKPAKGDLYLDTGVLQPGDVLLELGTGKDSTWIARATGGPFSHAALVMGRSFLFESDDLGVGYTPLKADRVERRATGTRTLSRLDGVKEAVLLRFPRFTAKQARDLGDDLIEALGPLDGKEYPAWSALASAAPGGRLGTQVGRVVLSILDWYQNTQVVVPGPFCSELIAGVFADVMPRRRLFDKPRDPTRVNPNTSFDPVYSPSPAPCARRIATPPTTWTRPTCTTPRSCTASRRQATGTMVGFRVPAKKADMSLRNIEKILQSFR